MEGIYIYWKKCKEAEHVDYKFIHILCVLFNNLICYNKLKYVLITVIYYVSVCMLFFVQYKKLRCLQ